LLVGTLDAFFVSAAFAASTVNTLVNATTPANAKERTFFIELFMDKSSLNNVCH
jgi:hypothetical protein